MQFLLQTVGQNLLDLVRDQRSLGRGDEAEDVQVFRVPHHAHRVIEHVCATDEK